jgi:hypothetical protein
MCYRLKRYTNHISREHGKRFMAMKKAAPKKKASSADGSDRGAKTKATEAKRKMQASVAGSDRNLKEKQKKAELAQLRKGPYSVYSDTGQMVTQMSELKRLQKRLAAEKELKVKKESARSVKQKQR